MIVGILAGYTSVILVMLLGQSRVFYSMSRDGLLPKLFSDIHPKFRTPWRCNLIFMVFVSLFSGFLPISSLGDMTSIGTLLAFVIVCAGIMVMRRTNPDLPRPYRTPLVPLVPILGILVCFAMMASLDIATWIRLVVWLVIGLTISTSPTAAITATWSPTPKATIRVRQVVNLRPIGNRPGAGPGKLADSKPTRI